MQGNTRHFFFFFAETPAPKKYNRFSGAFENSIGYVYQEKHVPRRLGKYVKNKSCTDCTSMCMSTWQWQQTVHTCVVWQQSSQDYMV